jgi:hypothetical protein
VYVHFPLSRTLQDGYGRLEAIKQKQVIKRSVVVPPDSAHLKSSPGKVVAERLRAGARTSVACQYPTMHWNWGNNVFYTSGIGI